MAAGLVDELHLIVGSVVLRTPAFASAPTAPLRLLGTRTFDDSDNVLIRYRHRPGIVNRPGRARLRRRLPCGRGDHDD